MYGAFRARQDARTQRRRELLPLPLTVKASRRPSGDRAMKLGELKDPPSGGGTWNSFKILRIALKEMSGQPPSQIWWRAVAARPYGVAGGFY